MLIKNIIGGILIYTSILDGWKYIWSAQGIKKIKTARGHSRKFINAAIFNDIVKLIYGFVILDMYIIFSSMFALTTMIYNFWIIYIYYPYRCRGLQNFKRPPIYIFIINSIIPNRYRRRL